MIYVCLFKFLKKIVDYIFFYKFAGKRLERTWRKKALRAAVEYHVSMCKIYYTCLRVCVCNALTVSHGESAIRVQYNT